eukprot:6490632-Amphidinium_carterae.1
MSGCATSVIHCRVAGASFWCRSARQAGQCKYLCMSVPGLPHCVQFADVESPRAKSEVWVQSPPDAAAAAKYAGSAPSFVWASCTGYHQYGGSAVQRAAAACLSAQVVTSASSIFEASTGVWRCRSRWNPAAVYMSVGDVSLQPTRMQDMSMAPHGPATACQGCLARRSRWAAWPSAHHQSLGRT